METLSCDATVSATTLGRRGGGAAGDVTRELNRNTPTIEREYDTRYSAWN